jgi:hypothetical protein
MAVLVIALLGLLVANLFYWLSGFVELMLMPDEDFPGRFDKALWVLLFLALPVLVAPLAFSRWREFNTLRLRRLRLEAAREATAAGQPAAEAAPRPQAPTSNAGITAGPGGA